MRHSHPCAKKLIEQLSGTSSRQECVQILQRARQSAREEFPLQLAKLESLLLQYNPFMILVTFAFIDLTYASEAYRQRLAQADVIPSMSRPGNCYDNAAMESFWSSLKRELFHRCQFATRAEARAAIFEWIEVFYNLERFHSVLGFKSPVDFEPNLN